MRRGGADATTDQYDILLRFPLAVVATATDLIPYCATTPSQHPFLSQEFAAIFAHLPSKLTQDLETVAALSEDTHARTQELSRLQAELIERSKAKLRQAGSW